MAQEFDLTVFKSIYGITPSRRYDYIMVCFRNSCECVFEVAESIGVEPDCRNLEGIAGNI